MKFFVMHCLTKRDHVVKVWLKKLDLCAEEIFLFTLKANFFRKRGLRGHVLLQNRFSKFNPQRAPLAPTQELAL